MSAWSDHVTKWKDCQACPLAQQRFRICLARGTVPCDVLLVGEAPGASEDVLGQPFVGPAGRLLDQIIDRALPKTISYALTNLVCCFPREAKTEGVNEPRQSEIVACRPRLIEFVNISQPKLIVCVGILSADYIDHGDTVPCVDIVHPAAILRMPLAQKQMAVQRAIVVVRNAVDAAMSANRSEFTNWGTRYASGKAKSERERLKDAYETWVNDPNIPF